MLDPGGFDEVFDQEYPRLLRVASLIVGDDGRAREIVQESFARALVRWDRVGRYDSPLAWLMTVTVRQAVRARDRRFREVAPRAEDPTLTVRGPADAVVAREVVLAALATLSPQQRAVVVLHHLEDLSVADVAARLGVRTGTVKTQLFRARARLAEIIGDDSTSDVPPGPSHPATTTEVPR